MVRYLFGESDLAAHRLKVLADVFADSTKSFVLRAVAKKPRLFVDLGCGPGHTTHLVASALQCDQAVGLDKSENFISLAAKLSTDRISFRLHDITRTPFPAEPADLLFCRFLITHLRDPLAVISRWATQLNSGGRLLMEEVEYIQTTNETFTAYLDIVEAMLKDQSGNLYVGPILDGFEAHGMLKTASSVVTQFPVRTHRAAAMFSLNIQTWKNQPFVVANYSSSLIADLEERLKQLAGERSDTPEIEWGLRHIALERI